MARKAVKKVKKVPMKRIATLSIEVEFEIEESEFDLESLENDIDGFLFNMEDYGGEIKKDTFSLPAMVRTFRT